jgi:hypothetical protein
MLMHGYTLQLRADEAGPERHHWHRYKTGLPDLRFDAPGSEQIHGGPCQRRRTGMRRRIQSALNDERGDAQLPKGQAGGQASGSSSYHEDVDLVIQNALHSSMLPLDVCIILLSEGIFL